MTKFSVEIENNEVKYELIRGKVSISERKRVDLNEEVNADSVNTRLMYITETINLNIRNPKYPNSPDNVDNRITLNSDQEIKAFFNEQSKKEKKLFLKSGPFTKSAFKFMNQGNTELALEDFKKAIYEGEIDRSRIIQASLIMSEGNFMNDKLNNTNNWLEVGLEFSKIENKIMQEKFDNYILLDKDAARAFGLQLITAKEYNAWAYSVKLKLSGCLESPEENPTKWLKDAGLIKKEIEKY